MKIVLYKSMLQGALIKLSLAIVRVSAMSLVGVMLYFLLDIVGVESFKCSLFIALH